MLAPVELHNIEFASSQSIASQSQDSGMPYGTIPKYNTTDNTII
jgi:hypothetical protein